MSGKPFPFRPGGRRSYDGPPTHYQSEADLFLRFNQLFQRLFESSADGRDDLILAEPGDILGEQIANHVLGGIHGE